MDPPDTGVEGGAHTSPTGHGAHSPGDPLIAPDTMYEISPAISSLIMRLFCWELRPQGPVLFRPTLERGRGVPWPPRSVGIAYAIARLMPPSPANPLHYYQFMH